VHAEAHQHWCSSRARPLVRLSDVGDHKTLGVSGRLTKFAHFTCYKHDETEKL
jgi:hypothetical protein